MFHRIGISPIMMQNKNRLENLNLNPKRLNLSFNLKTKTLNFNLKNQT
jgi:hypothetical protein